jgi:CubicO group peptidase (beta-lactamase class C family)
MDMSMPARIFGLIIYIVMALTGCGKGDDTDLSDVTTANPESTLPEVDALMAEFDRTDVPGAAVVVIKDGAVIHAKGYGLADLSNDAPSMAETSYRLASVSKQFIAMAIAMLEESGRLSYDTTLTELFPGFPSYGRGITVRHLLQHTSGLHSYESMIPSGQTTQLSDQDVLRLYRERTGSTRFTPGSAYSYSNGGYVLLGLAVEAVTGQTLGTVLNEFIFAPLGMRSVMYEGESTPIVNRAFGYTRKSNGWSRTDQSVTSATRGDGGIYASVADLFLWDRALYTENLVSAATMRKIFTPGRLNNGASTGYGFGWELGSYRGRTRQSHTGSTIGFRTVIHRYPGAAGGTSGFTVAVLINREGSTPWNYATTIADRLLFP